MSYNRAIFMGRLTAAPEMKATSEGTEYCNFTIAVDRPYSKDKKKETDFIRCKAWRTTAAFINSFFAKGTMILVEGQWRIDKYEKDGEFKEYSYCLVDKASFCGSKSDIAAPAPAPAETKPDEGDFKEIPDEDLPF